MKSSFNLKAIIATLASLTMFAKCAPADTPLQVTLCNDINFGNCQTPVIYRYHCYQLDKATMGLSSIKFSSDNVIGCFLAKDLHCKNGFWMLESNSDLRNRNFNDVANSYVCQ